VVGVFDRSNITGKKEKTGELILKKENSTVDGDA